MVIIKNAYECSWNGKQLNPNEVGQKSKWRGS